MSLIHIKNLTFCYEGSYEAVFEDISLQLDTNWKLGLVGRNGRGKTTLLRILSGALPYSGSISAQVRFEYFPHSPEDPQTLTMDVLREASGAEDWQIFREAALIGMPEDALWQVFSLLSHGERTKALLSAMFLREGCFPLIDEPTNHLDLEARRKLRDYLSAKSGFILVSHDRTLLDGCVDHILSINRADIELRRGNFSSWLQDKENRDKFEAAENEKLKKDIGRLKDAAQRAAAFSQSAEQEKHTAQRSGLSPDRGFLGHKAAKLMQRSKNIARRREDLIAEKSGLLRNTDAAEALKISPLRFHTNCLLQLRDVSIRYGDKAVCGGVSFALHEGDRLVLRGKNGSGKSSILRLILGEPLDYSGALIKNDQLKISYVPQSTEGLSGPAQAYAHAQGIETPLFLSILRKLGLERTQFEKPLEDYSAGQKKKVLLAASLCRQANLYIWDEPLNYIDVLSRMQIEQLIADYGPTMLLVEHDAVFCETICTGFVELA